MDPAVAAAADGQRSQTHAELLALASGAATGRARSSSSRSSGSSSSEDSFERTDSARSSLSRSSGSSSSEDSFERTDSARSSFSRSSGSSSSEDSFDHGGATSPSDTSTEPVEKSDTEAEIHAADGMGSSTESEGGPQSPTAGGSESESYTSGTGDTSSTGVLSQASSGERPGAAAALSMIMRAKNRFRDLGTVVLDSSSSDEDSEGECGTHGNVHSESYSYYSHHSEYSYSTSPHSSSGQHTPSTESIAVSADHVAGVASSESALRSTISSSGSGASESLEHNTQQVTAAAVSDAAAAGKAESVAVSARPSTPAAQAAWRALVAEVEAQEDAWSSLSADAVLRAGRRVNVPGVGHGMIVASDTPVDVDMAFIRFDSGLAKCAPLAEIQIIDLEYMRRTIASILDGEFNSRATESHGRSQYDQHARHDGGQPVDVAAELPSSPGAAIVAPVMAKKQQKAAEEALADAERKVRIARYMRQSAVERVADDAEAHQVLAQLEEAEKLAETAHTAAGEQVRLLAETKARTEAAQAQAEKVQAELKAMHQLEDQVRADAAAAEIKAKRAEQQKIDGETTATVLKRFSEREEPDDDHSNLVVTRETLQELALAAMTAMEVSESDRTADHRQTLLQWVGSVPFFQKQRAERGSASRRSAKTWSWSVMVMERM